VRNEQPAVELEKAISELLACQGLELVEFVYRFEGQGIVLRAIVDYPQGGIEMGECARLNKMIGAMLDARNMIEANYILEVCSPGLDRPLRSELDFRRCAQRPVKCFLKEPINGKIEWDGVIKDVSGSRVVLETSEGSLEVPIEKINKAKQIIKV
jgi:ribosome maturation factor RimP